MLELNSVSNPRTSGLESAALETRGAQRRTPGAPGSASGDVGRSAKFLLVAGQAAPGGLESLIGGRDDRTRILDTELSPWRMICSLRMRGPRGGGAVGTGWFAGPRTIITAGHCVYSDTFFGGWAAHIEVAPGRNDSDTPFGPVTSRKFTSLDRWVSREDPDFDIGCIHLDEPLGEKTGWFGFAALPPVELTGRRVNISGYPSERGDGDRQYFHSDAVLHVGDRRLFCAYDSTPGQSGAPVWLYADDDPQKQRPVVVGIHAYGVGSTPAALGITANSAPRIIPEVFDRIQSWIQDGP